LQLGLVISVILHAAILGWTLVSFRSQQQLRTPEPEPVAVGMIAPSEVTRVKLGSRTAKQLEAEAKESPKGEVAKKDATKAKVAAAAPPPPPPPPPDPIAQKLAEPPPLAPATPPPPAPAEAQKKLEAEKLKVEEQRRIEEQKQAEEAALRAAEEKKKAEEKKRAEEQRRQAELKKKREEEKKRREAALKKKREEEKKRQEAEAAKKKQFNADKIAALLNKVPDAAPPPPSAPPDQPTKAKGPALGAQEGRDKQISASELAMIGQIIKSCVRANWTVLSGGASAQETTVKIRLRFNADGSLSAPPEIMNRQNTPYFLAISDSAIRAIQQCEPFNLPPAKYDAWKDLVLNFQPRDMF
jgi:colicin import membrane protein